MVETASTPMLWPGVLCGLASEAAIARQILPLVELGAARSDQARAAAHDLIARGAQGLVSFGIAGGLDPRLSTGDLVIAETIASASRMFTCLPAWVDALGKVLPKAKLGCVLGTDKVLLSAQDKARAFEDSGALAVDMESHIVAEVARAAGLPFIALRAIADGAAMTLPSLVVSGLKSDGTPDVARGVIYALTRPWQIGALLTTQAASTKALDALFRRGGVALLGLGGLGGVDLGHRLLDV